MPPVGAFPESQQFSRCGNEAGLFSRCDERKPAEDSKLIGCVCLLEDWLKANRRGNTQFGYSLGDKGRRMVDSFYSETFFEEHLFRVLGCKSGLFTASFAGHVARSPGELLVPGAADGASGAAFGGMQGAFVCSGIVNTGVSPHGYNFK